MKINNGTASIVVGVIIAVGLVAQSIAGDTANGNSIRTLRGEFYEHCKIAYKTDVDTQVNIAKLQKDVSDLVKYFELKDAETMKRARILNNDSVPADSTE